MPTSRVNNPDQDEKLELERIRRAYLEWARKVPPHRYAPTNPERICALREFEAALVDLLRADGIESLSAMRVLDVGCGRGTVLRRLVKYGADPELLFGADLRLEGLIEGPRPAHRIKGICCSASQLPFSDASFDVVLQFTLFTSVLSSIMRRQIASEISRVLVPGGRLIWYDFVYDSPRNRNVRGIRRAEIRKLFPQFTMSVRRVTVAPPLGRLLARFGAKVYQWVAAAKVLSTHDLCLLRKGSCSAE
jgi:ubiquinone/menaquinone biosynthesis C-methylase UbiE